MSTCSRCSSTVGPDDRFCMECGRPLEGADRSAVLVEDPDRTDHIAPIDAPLDDAEEPHTDAELLEDDEGRDLVACPRCGSSNAARRAICGRCGRRLRDEPPPAWEEEPGVGPVRADAQDDVAVEREPPASASRHAVVVAIVVLGVVVGAGLGLAAGLGIGPFARVEPVTFDAVAYPDDPEAQRPATTASSSTSSADGARTFGPELTVDGRRDTAWRAADETEGALLRHGFVAPVWVERIEVATGDQADETAFARTGRVTEAVIDLGTLRLDATIAGTDDVQVIVLPEPVLTDEVTWEVTGTTGGVPAMSEVRYLGWPADEADEAAYRGS